MRKLSNIKIYLFYLIAISTLIRCFIANIVELGGDEAYYWTFALYPKLSHLDQPPMIGWLIQLFTNNLSLNSVFFTRFASIFIGSVNTWIVFVLGRRMKNELTGLYAAFLYTTSIYYSIITGVFISPDAPQSLFMLLSIYFLHDGFIIKYDDCEESRTLRSISMIMAGVFVGLAMLSKFSSGLIWVGVLLYVVFFDKQFLKKYHLYLSSIISILILSPVIIWNVKYNFIGFRYINNILFTYTDHVTIISIIQALFKQIIYNNPINIAIAVAAIFTFKRIPYLKNAQYKLLLSISIPFLLFGFFTLSFFPFILLSGSYLETKYNFARIKLPRVLKNSILIYLLIVLLGIIQLYSGFIKSDVKKSPEIKIGTNDKSLDYYGWKTLSKEFKYLRDYDIALGNISEHAYIISNNYSSAAHYEYYLAKPEKIFVKTIGELKETRKFAFTTQEQGGFKIGDNAYYIESSRDLKSGISIGKSYFNTIEVAKTLYIKRNNKPVLRYTIYRFKKLKTVPEQELTSVKFI